MKNMVKTKEYKRFCELARARAKVERALLDATYLIYTDKMAEKIVSKKKWKKTVLNDLEECTRLAYQDCEKYKRTGV